MKDNKERVLWTYDKCKEEALKYVHKKDFKKNSSGAYKSSSRNGWIEELCSHMVGLKKSIDSYTIEECKNEASKYKTRTEFCKQSKKHYTVCSKNNWLDVVCSHMFEVKKKSKNTTFEQCVEEAKKYNTRHEFQLKAQLFYKVSREKNWLDDVCVHMEEVMKPKGYWNYNNCKNEALKYTTRNDFHKNSRSAYSVCQEKDWMDELCSHMKDGYKIFADSIRIWNYDKCKEEALKYETRNEFSEKTKVAYDVCLKNGWMDEFCVHMKDGRKISADENRIWTFEKCKEEALKYETKGEFSKKSSSSYSACLKNGWIEELCSHMKVCGNQEFRFVYVFEFEDNHAYVGLTYDVDDREIKHLSKEGEPVYEHIKKTNAKYKLLTLIDKPIPKEDAQELEHKTKLRYIENGWNILNKGKTGRGIGSLGGGKLKWTYEKCKEEALKCSSKSEFQKKSKGAYNACLRNNWSKELFSHMSLKIKPHGYWTYDKCKEEVLKFKTKKEFKNSQGGAYCASQKNGWMDKLFPNDKKSKPPGYWTYEKCKEEALKYETQEIFKKNCSSAYNTIRKNGWFEELCSHFIVQQKPSGYWTYDKCKEEALKYESKTDFKDGSNSAYAKCSENKWIDELCSHMKELKKPNKHWNSFENCKEEASKHKTRIEFKKNASTAFRMSQKNNWTNDFFPPINH